MSAMIIPDMPDDVKSVFDGYPDQVTAQLMKLRALIYKVSIEHAQIGSISEELKWGQPSYLTHRPKSGTTIRLGDVKNRPGHVGLYVHCQTSLIQDLRHLFADELEFETTRVIILDADKPFDEAIIRTCITSALSYHLKK